jgi:hypothetical protein
MEHRSVIIARSAKCKEVLKAVVRSKKFEEFGRDYLCGFRDTLTKHFDFDVTKVRMKSH